MGEERVIRCAQEMGATHVIALLTKRAEFHFEPLGPEKQWHRILSQSAHLLPIPTAWCSPVYMPAFLAQGILLAVQSTVRRQTPYSCRLSV